MQRRHWGPSSQPILAYPDFPSLLPPSPPPPHHPTPLATGPEPPYVWTYCRHRGRSSGLVTNASSRRNTALTAFPSHSSPSGFFFVLILVPNKIMWLHCCCFCSVFASRVVDDCTSEQVYTDASSRATTGPRSPAASPCRLLRKPSYSP